MHKFIIVFLFFLVSSAAASRPDMAAPDADSLEFAGFSSVLGKIFSQDKIQTILSKLPPNCKIYGFDVGDFSGDDGMDLVLSTRMADSRSREMLVHFFINDGPAFKLVETLPRQFILETIEVGFSVERGIAFVTEKTSEFGWRITGYAVQDNVFRRVQEWQTDRMPYRGRETAVAYDRDRNYSTHLVEEHFYGVNTHRSFLRQKYYDLPLFREGDDIPRGIRREIGDSTALMIVRGGSSWHGADDCSVFVSGSYDSSKLVIGMRIHDDRLLYHENSDSSDYAALYFDLSRKTRLLPGGGEQEYSPNSQFGIIIMMGDGENRGPVVELRGAKLTKLHGDEIAVHLQRDEVEYQLFHFTVTLPIALFESKGTLPEAGFVALYHDVDYPANLSWVSLASSSRGFADGNPETYGRMHFVDDARETWEWDDLGTRELGVQLRRAGILP